ncbi:unnamed protein product [Ectocarpus sp. CCAP 1310/34]|nr:unnamed protein product [Ectocarpus sp. CCAP 1310/34]
MNGADSHFGGKRIPGVAVSGVWGNMGLSGGCLRKSKTADVSLLV